MSTAPREMSNGWLRLTWALQAALSPACLSLAAAGLFLTSCVSVAIGYLAPNVDPPSFSQLSTLPFVRHQLEQHLAVDGGVLPLDPIVGVPSQIAGHAFRLFRTGQPWNITLYHLFSGLANVAIWGFFGLAIVRIAVMECGQQQRTPIREALRFASRKWLHAAGAPAAVVLTIMLVSIPVFAASWLIRTDIGLLIVGVGWIVVLAFATLMTVLAMGLAFGWPLMWGAIAAEDSDLFDAVSRSFAYTLQRPGRYLTYTFLACLLGILAWVVAIMASELIVELAYWSIQVGGGSERTLLLRDLVANVSSDTESGVLAEIGADLVRAANHVPAFFAAAFSYSFFWCSWGAIYLMLRFDTDQTAFDDILTQPPRAPTEAREG